jgi:catechol 2,3-dioxygenase-like lactoylglutathione lyase family enzyme
MNQDSASLFTRLAPVLNVRDVAAERAFYERLGLPVIYEGEEYPDFIGFGTETVHFGIQKAVADNDPPSVLTWQIGVTDIESAIERCRSAGISFELEMNNPAPGWSYRRLLIRTPGGYRLALEGPNELQGPDPARGGQLRQAMAGLSGAQRGAANPERAGSQHRNDRRVDHKAPSAPDPPPSPG